MRPCVLAAALMLAGGVLSSPARADDANPACDDSGYAKTVDACGRSGETATAPRCVERLAKTVRACQKRLSENERATQDDEHRSKVALVTGYLGTLQRLSSVQQRELSAQPPADQPQAGAPGPAKAGALAGGGGAGGDQAPAAPAPSLDDAKAALAAGRAGEAVAAADRILASDPGNVEALTVAAQAQASLGDRDAAVEDARKILAIDPENRFAQVLAGHEGPIDASTLSKLKRPDFGGDRAAEEGPGGAERSRRRAPEAAAQAAAPAYVFTRTAGPADAALDEARRYAALGDYARAEAEIDRALALNAKNAAALAARAMVLNRRRDFDGAIAAAESALALDPKNVAALLERGYARCSLGKYREALADVEQALAIDPLNAMGHLYRAMILEKMQRAQEAIAEYMKAAELDPGLKPLVDAALARLGLRSADAAGRAARRLWPLWAAAILLAAALLAYGLKRVIRPEWATPATPLR